MMWEEKWGSAMINAEMRGAIRTACEYAKVLCTYIGVPEKDMPNKVMIKGRKREEIIADFEEHYFTLLELIGKQISKTLKEVRVKYRDKNMDIPQVEKQ